MLKAYKELEITDVAMPELAAGDVLIQVKACGICGSDVHGYDGSTGRRIPPLVMGHEASGVVHTVGEGVEGFEVGDRVTFDSTVYCGDCYFCNRGQVNLCDDRKVLGVSCGEYRQHGAFAEFVRVPARICYALPDELSFEHAAMIEAVSVAVHAVNRAEVVEGESAVVIGTGMIGLLVVQALRDAGCGQVIAVDLDEGKLDLALELGATGKINAGDEDLSARIAGMTEGRGVDIAVEVVGATQPLETCVQSVRKGGRVVLVGNLAPKVELSLQRVVTGEISLLGSCASNGEYPQCIEAMAGGRINVEPLISARIGLDEAAGYFQRLYDGEDGLMKVIVQPGG